MSRVAWVSFPEPFILIGSKDGSQISRSHRFYVNTFCQRNKFLLSIERSLQNRSDNLASSWRPVSPNKALFFHRIWLNCLTNLQEMCVSEHVGGKSPHCHPPTEKTDHHSPSAQIWLSASISTLATADCSFGGYLISLLFEQSTVPFHYHSMKDLSNLQWDLSRHFHITPTMNGPSHVLLLNSVTDYRFQIHNIVQ